MRLPALALLGLTAQSTKEEFARAKKLKLRQLHPDKNHDDPEATAKTQRILRASEVLLEKHFNTSQSRSSAIAVLCP